MALAFLRSNDGDNATRMTIEVCTCTFLRKTCAGTAQESSSIDAIILLCPRYRQPLQKIPCRLKPCCGGRRCRSPKPQMLHSILKLCREPRYGSCAIGIPVEYDAFENGPHRSWSMERRKHDSCRFRPSRYRIIDQLRGGLCTGNPDSEKKSRPVGWQPQ